MRWKSDQTDNELRGLCEDKDPITRDLATECAHYRAMVTRLLAFEKFLNDAQADANAALERASSAVQAMISLLEREIAAEDMKDDGQLPTETHERFDTTEEEE